MPSQLQQNMGVQQSKIQYLDTNDLNCVGSHYFIVDQASRNQDVRLFSSRMIRRKNVKFFIFHSSIFTNHDLRSDIREMVFYEYSSYERDARCEICSLLCSPKMQL